MGAVLKEIESAALQLEPEERAHLAERLLLSLEPEAEILAEWAEEAERRGSAFERGEIDAVSMDEALARARSHLPPHSKT